MAQTIKLKRSSVSGNTPSTSDLELGEVAINTYDGKMFIKKNDGSDSIVEIGGTSGTVTEAFKTIAVSGQSNVVADSATDTLTLVAGSNMTITTNASGDTITFASSGGGGTQNVFSTFAVSGQSSVVADSTTDTLTLVAGSGITLTTDASNDEITITNSATGANAFGNIAVSGQSTVAADSTNDTLTLTAGSGITLTTDATNDGVTIAATASAITVQDEGSSLSTSATTLNFVGAGVTASGTGATKTITIGGGSSQNVFSNIGVSGQGTIQADSTTDTLTFEAGTGISLATDTTNDKLTITATGGTANVANAASSIKEFKYDITSSTTTITGSDANSNTLAYEAGAIQVFLNGILLDPATDYTASNGTSVVLTDAAVSGDDLQIVAFNRKIVTANVGLSTFTGDGTTTAFTLSSDPVNENNTRVHIDGVYQEKAAYSVSGTTLTFSGAPPNGSSIEVEIGFTQAEIGSTLDFADNAILRIGTGNDLQILHDGSNSIIKDTGTGDLQIAASTLEVKNSGLSETMLKAIEDGAVELYFDNSKKLETVTGGVTITGTVTATTFSGDLSGTINTATTGTTQSASDNSTKIATTAYVDTAVTNLVDSAPGTLNTLNELAAALGDDANFSTTITNSLNLKVGRDSATGAASIPAGTTAQRPGSPAAGQFRYNSTLNQFEGYTSSWGAIGGGGTNTFTTDVFTVTGATGAGPYTLTQAVTSPNDCIVHVDGIYQTPTDAYTVSGTSLTFTATPATGRKIVVYSVRAGVSGNNVEVQTINGNGSDHTFTLNVNPVNENNTIVHIDGVYQQKSSYTVSGTSLSFGSGNIPANGTVIEVATFTQTEVNVPVNNTIDTVHIKNSAVTSAKLGGNLTTPGTLTSTGLLTADAGVAIDNITIDGTEIDLSSGDLTLDVAGDIILDADGGDVAIKDGGTSLLAISNAGSNNVQISTQINDGDLLIRGIDNTTPFTALTLDMSEAGNAHFNQHAYFVDNGKAIFGGGSDLQIYHDGTNNRITSNTTFAIDTVDFLVRSSDGSESLISGTQNAAVTLYHNNSAKLATTAGGIAVTGQGDFSTQVLVGNNNSHFSENNIRFQSAGAAYFDHNTTGQSFVFRTSNSSALDTTALIIDHFGNSTIRSGGKLILNRADNATGGEITYGPTGTGFIINDVNGDDTIFKTGSTEHMRILGGGNVGIGTPAPSALAHVYNGTLQVGSKTGDTSIQQNANAIRIAAVPNSSTEWGGLQWYREFSDVIGAEIIAARPGSTEAETDLIIKTSPNSSNAVEVVRIDHDGHVNFNGPSNQDVGGTGPGTVIRNHGQLRVGTNDGTNFYTKYPVYLDRMNTAGNGPHIVFARNGQYKGGIGAIQEGGGNASSAEGSLVLYTGTWASPTNERIYIKAGGDVGIGTSPSGSKLHVVKSGSGVKGRFSDGTSETLDIGISANSHAYLDQPNGGPILFNISSAEQARIATTGIAFPSGKGIDFSAAPGVTAGSSTVSGSVMKDYEYGSYTPVMSDYYGNSASYSGTLAGWYVKIGNFVQVWFKGDTIGVSGATGGSIFQISLPYNKSSGTTEGAGTVMFHGFTGGGNHYGALIIGNTNKVSFIGSNNNNGSWNWVTNNMITGSTSFRASISYQAP